MKKQSIFLAFFATGALLLSGCSTNAGTGAVIGSLVGAGLGKSTSNHKDKRAAISAALGGIVGAAIGSERDRALRHSSTVATTSPYYDKPVSSSESVEHTHKYSSGDETHAHSGGANKHTHSQSREYVEADTEDVYAEPYPVSSTIIIGGGYYDYPRRYYRGRHYRHHNRHRHYNRYRNHRGHHNRIRY